MRNYQENICAACGDITRKLVSITCDVCGAEFSNNYPDDMNTIFEIQEFVNIAFTGGYLSTFGDGYSYEANVCQYCAKEILGDYLRCTDAPSYDADCIGKRASD